MSHFPTQAQPLSRPMQADLPHAEARWGRVGGLPEDDEGLDTRVAKAMTPPIDLLGYATPVNAGAAQPMNASAGLSLQVNLREGDAYNDGDGSTPAVLEVVGSNDGRRFYPLSPAVEYTFSGDGVIRVADTNALRYVAVRVKTAKTAAGSPEPAFAEFHWHAPR